MAWKKTLQNEDIKQEKSHDGNIGSNISSGKGIIEIIIMQKTVIHIYPNGLSAIQKHLSSSWIQGMAQVYKKSANQKRNEKGQVLEIGKIEDAQVREL